MMTMLLLLLMMMMMMMMGIDDDGYNAAPCSTCKSRSTTRGCIPIPNASQEWKNASENIHFAEIGEFAVA
jgi:hypothetical protein